MFAQTERQEKPKNSNMVLYFTKLIFAVTFRKNFARRDSVKLEKKNEISNNHVIIPNDLRRLFVNFVLGSASDVGKLETTIGDFIQFLVKPRDTIGFKTMYVFPCIATNLQTNSFVITVIFRRHVRV